MDTPTKWMPILATLSFLLGFVALLSSKIYIDKATNPSLEVDMPFVGKMNYPSLLRRSWRPDCRLLVEAALHLQSDSTKSSMNDFRGAQINSSGYFRLTVGPTQTSRQGVEVDGVRRQAK
jgi:hypothetical protein